MVLTWPRTDHARAARQLVLGLGDDPVDLRGDEAEIGVLHRSVDVDHRRGVVVADDAPAQRRGGRSRGSPAAAACRRRRGAERRRRRSLRDASLYCGVCAATLYCVPLLGSIQNDGVRLEAAGERHQHVRCHVALGHAEQRRLAAIDVDLELRMVEDLLDAQVHGARHAAHPLEQPIRV